MIADPVLVLVDMQNDFCKPGYQYLSDSDPVIEDALVAAGAFLERYRASGRTPILVRTTHDPRNTSDVWMEKYGSEEDIPCRSGSEGAAFAPELDAREEDAVVTKHRYSGFYGTNLETLLSSNGVERLLVGGVNTEICVASTVYDAFNRDYRVSVLPDCTATNDARQHESAVRNFDANFGGVVESGAVDLSPV